LNKKIVKNGTDLHKNHFYFKHPLSSSESGVSRVTLVMIIICQRKSEINSNNQNNFTEIFIYLRIVFESFKKVYNIIET